MEDEGRACRFRSVLLERVLFLAAVGVNYCFVLADISNTVLDFGSVSGLKKAFKGSPLNAFMFVSSSDPDYSLVGARHTSAVVEIGIDRNKNTIVFPCVLQEGRVLGPAESRHIADVSHTQESRKLSDCAC
jgi:hypothetical protein